MTRVKICGVTRIEDALAAVRAGADAIGFNFHPGSRRYISPLRAAELVAALPPAVEAIGVFVNASAAEVADAVALSGVGAAQLHGEEPPAVVEALQCAVIKALPAGPGVAEQMRRYVVSAFLLDAATGGSGRTFDWELARAVDRSVPLYLAGGLDEGNVREAVARVRPDYVDVATGVEDAPGIKNAEKIARFIAAAKEASR